MKVDTTIDYAPFLLNADQALKDMHSALLEKDTVAALAEGLRVITEVKLAINAIKSHD